MPLRALEHLFEDSDVRKFSKGQVLLYPGDDLKYVYYVIEGYVKVYTINENGEERIFMLFPPKTAFPILPNGVESENYKLRYFYQTMTSAKIYQLSRDSFNQILADNHDAANIVLDYITQLAGDMVRRLGIIENKDARSKIANVLRYLVKISGEEVKPHRYKIRLKTTHQDIASMAGLTRETASVQIKHYENECIIEQQTDKRLIINELLLPE